MNKKTSGLIVILLMVASFLAGSSIAGKQDNTGLPKKQETAKTTSAPVAPTPIPFEAKKTTKPEIKFFVMSFCPYGNQAELGLEPVYQLLKDKVTWTPRYIVSDKKKACEQSCPFKVYDENQCNQLVADKRVPDMETCKGYFPFKDAAECLKKECANLKAGEYESLHGQQEFNQDIREIIAYNSLVESGDKVLGAKTEGILAKWWKFVSLVNTKCSSSDADTCWKEQATAAGLDASDIAKREKAQVKTLADKEIEEAGKYQASGSPTIFINDVLYNGGRSPEDYKKAICASFESQPEECGQVLGQETTATSGGCGQ